MMQHELCIPIDGEPSYRETVILSSTGEASEVQYKMMGVYEMVNDQLVYGRPVWKQIDNDLFIFFSGNR